MCLWGALSAAAVQLLEDSSTSDLYNYMPTRSNFLTPAGNGMSRRAMKVEDGHWALEKGGNRTASTWIQA